MTQEFIIFATIELFVLCFVLYFVIRANIYVNTLQYEVNELYFYFPAAIRDLKADLKEFNKGLRKTLQSTELSHQDIGFLAGKLSAQLLFSRMNMNPFRKNFVIVSLLFNLWKIREGLKSTILKLFLK